MYKSHGISENRAPERAREETAAALEVESLCKSLGGRRVLEGVTLRLGRGEGVALRGPNGAGKTTLLLLCAGVLRPDAGTVRVAGRSITAREARRALGLVPQEAALYEELTGAENVALFARLAGLRGRELAQRTERALHAADLWQVRGMRAGMYSGGMRRRLSAACALVHGPSLLLLDEPFVGLDDDSRRKLCSWLARQKSEGLALLLSTHQGDEVGALCERALTLGPGRTGDLPLPLSEPLPTRGALVQRANSSLLTGGARP